MKVLSVDLIVVFALSCRPYVLMFRSMSSVLCKNQVLCCQTIKKCLTLDTDVRKGVKTNADKGRG